VPPPTWPFSPRVLDRTNLGAQNTNSTTGVDLWGGGATKSLGHGEGMVLIYGHLLCLHTLVTGRADFQLQVSEDGVVWTPGDPTVPARWFTKSLAVTNALLLLVHPVDLLFVYDKNQHREGFARIRWKTNGGVLSLAADTADGFASTIRALKFPTWE